MIVYVETSALVKCYLDEYGSDQVDTYLEDAEVRLSSGLTQLELIAAIELAKRIRRINSPEYRTKMAAINADITAERISFLSVSSIILKRAIPLIRVHRLRAPDAIQLSTAIESNKGYSGELHFLCADRALLGAARSEGLRCKNVSS